MENLTTTSRSVSNTSIGLSYPNSNYIETGATNGNNGSSSKTTDSNNTSSSKAGPLLSTLLAFRDHLDRDSFRDFVHECRNSRKLVLLVVFIALFFDNMLLTTVGKAWHEFAQAQYVTDWFGF